MSRRVMALALEALNIAADQIGCEYDDDRIGLARKELRATLRHPDYMEGPHQSPAPMSHADWLDIGQRRGWVRIAGHTKDDFK